MNGHDYEHLVARYLRGHGYTGVSVTKASGDYGVDVIACRGGHKYAIQCKHYTGAVGVSAIQEAVAGKAYYGCDRAMVVTNSTFTKAACELASVNNVVLMENITRTSSKARIPKVVKWILLISYPIIAYALIASAIEESRNLVIPICLAVSPISIYLAYNGLRAFIRKQKSKQGQQVTLVKPQSVHPASASLVTHKEYTINEAALISCLESPESEYSDQAREIAKELSNSKQISISLIQRRFKYGYARAARLMDLLENNGFVLREIGQYKWSDKAKIPSYAPQEGAKEG